MKHLIIVPLLAGALYLLPVRIATADDITLSDMVRSVQSALLGSQNLILDEKLPELDTVSLNLRTVLKEKTNGGFTLYVVSIGGDHTSTTTSSVTLELIPPRPRSASDVSKATVIQDSLQSAIVAAAKAIRVARTGQPTLDAKLVEISIVFVLETSNTGGIRILFPPFEASIEGKISNGLVQTITVRFK